MVMLLTVVAIALVAIDVVVYGDVVDVAVMVVGIVTTLAGSTATTPVSGNINGIGTNALFTKTNGIVADTSGNVFIAQETDAIRKIDSNGWCFRAILAVF